MEQTQEVCDDLHYVVNDWLDDTKDTLLKNLDLVNTTKIGDRETIEIMKNMVQIMKAKPIYPGGKY